MASAESLPHRTPGPAPTSDGSCSSTVWTTAWRVWESLKNAWFWFDKHAGYWLGLDVPKYAWAISEHYRLLKEGEESVFTSEFKKKEIQMDELEGQIGGPPQAAMTAPNIADVNSQGMKQPVNGQGSTSKDAPVDASKDAPVDAHEKYGDFKA
ncbi:hypothetical protein DUNSADRAFT_8188 [Dunaliella salina]|uniref:Uncharacterized protein n=1 Tax=Dunaliella salina TaxID=3046 RepID=A0ABQ7GJV6_DUNSA|nr:hypothetical protein DUNSADRAFT_8188 [Dunaliella salina]|eukprot:KAF5834884.1 hypothetical protein DUNSADRAFT_8188 [Dunaliella salina]